MKRSLLIFAAPLLLLSAALCAADLKLDGIKCLIADGKGANADKAVDYKGGKVFFCCDGCKGNFSKDPTKFAAKANLQLALTGQAKQEKCPFSGGPVDAEKTVEVAGFKVGFCCDGCKGKVAAADEKDRLEMCFKDKAFDKGFVVEKK